MSQSNQRIVPEGLRDIMRSLTKEILHEKPTDIYKFSQKYFESVLQRKTEFEAEAYELIGNHKINNDVLKRSQIPPLYLVFAIIPDEISKLIREFIKAVLRENPTNIYKFAVRYFKRLQNVGGITEYTTYENYMKRKGPFSFAPYVKCTCGRMVGNQQDTEYAYSNISHIVNMTSGTKFSSNAAFDIKEQNPAVSIKQQNNALHRLTASACVLQRFFRRILKRKTLLMPEKNIAKDRSIKNQIAMSEQSAALIIQKALRKLYEDRGKQHRNSASEYLKQNKTSNENISEADSYTSASTALMYADSACEKVQCGAGDFAEKADSSNAYTFLSEDTNMRENYHYIPENSNYSTKTDIGPAETEQNEYEFRKVVGNGVNIHSNPKTNYELQTEIDALNQKPTLLSTVNGEVVLETANQTTTDPYIEDNKTDMDLYLKNLNMTHEIKLEGLNNHKLEHFVPRNTKESEKSQTTINPAENEIDDTKYAITFPDNFVSDVQNNTVGFLDSDTKDIKNIVINKKILTETPHNDNSYLEGNIKQNLRSRSPDNSAEFFHLKQSNGVLSPDNEMLVLNTSSPSKVRSCKGQQNKADDLPNIPKKNETVVNNVDMSDISEKSETDVNNIANPLNISTIDSVICNMDIADIQSNHEAQKISILPCQEHQFTESKHMRIEEGPTENLSNNRTGTENKRDFNGMHKNILDDKSITFQPESELKVMLEKRKIVAEIVLNDAVLIELKEEETNHPESNNILISNTDIEKSCVDNSNLAAKIKVCQNMDGSTKSKSTENSDLYKKNVINSETLKSDQQHRYVDDISREADTSLYNDDIDIKAVSQLVTKSNHTIYEDTNSCGENPETSDNCLLNTLNDSENISIACNIINGINGFKEDAKCLKDNFGSKTNSVSISESETIKCLNKNIIKLSTDRSSDVDFRIESIITNISGTEDTNSLNEKSVEDFDKSQDVLLESNLMKDTFKLNDTDSNNLLEDNTSNINPQLNQKNLVAIFVEDNNDESIHRKNEMKSELTSQDTKNKCDEISGVEFSILHDAQDTLMHISADNETISENNTLTDVLKLSSDQLLTLQNGSVTLKKEKEDSGFECKIDENISQQLIRDDTKKTNTDTPKSTGLQKITEEIDSLPAVETIGTQNSILNKLGNISVEKYIHNSIKHFENNDISQIESIPKISTTDKFPQSIEDIHSYCETTSISNQEPSSNHNKDGGSCWELDQSENSDDSNEQAFDEDSLEVESPKETDIEEDSLETSSNTKNIEVPYKLYTDIERTPTYLYGVLSPKHTQIFRRNSSKISTAFTIPFDNRSNKKCHKLTKKASKATDVLESSRICLELNSPDKILNTEITNNDKSIKNGTEEVQLPLQLSTQLFTKVTVLQDGNDLVDLTDTDVEANPFQIDIVSSICGEGIEEKCIQHNDTDVEKDELDDYESSTAFETTLLTTVEVKESQILRPDNINNKTANDINKEIIRSDADYNIKDVSSGYNDLLINATSSNEIKEVSDNNIIIKSTVNKDSIPIGLEKVEEERSQQTILLDESLKNNENANFAGPDDKLHTNIKKIDLNDKNKSNMHASMLNSKTNVVKTESEKTKQENIEISARDKKNYNAAKKIQTFFINIKKKNLNSNESKKLVFNNSNNEKQNLGNTFQDKLSSDSKIIGRKSDMHDDSDHLSMAVSLITEIINSTVQLGKVQKQGLQQKYLVQKYNSRDLNNLPVENKEHLIKAAIKIQEAFRKYKYEKKYKPFDDYLNQYTILNCTTNTPIRNVENVVVAAIKIQQAFRKYLAQRGIYRFSDSTRLYSPNNIGRNTQIIKGSATNNESEIVEDVATDGDTENEGVIIRQILSTSMETEHSKNSYTNIENRTTLREPLQCSTKNYYEKVNWFVGNEPITPTAMSKNCNAINNFVQVESSCSQNDISSSFASFNCSSQNINQSDKSSVAARPSRKVENNLFSTSKQNNDSYINKIVSATKSEECPDEVHEFSNIIKTNNLETDIIENDSNEINHDEAILSDFNKINGFTKRNLEDKTDMYSKYPAVSIKDRNAIKNEVIQNMELTQDVQTVDVASKPDIETDNFNIGAIVSDFINMEKQYHMDEVEIHSKLHAAIMQETYTEEGKGKPYFTGTGDVGLKISDDDIPTLNNNNNETLTSINYLCSEDTEPIEICLSNRKSPMQEHSLNKTSGKIMGIQSFEQDIAIKSMQKKCESIKTFHTVEEYNVNERCFEEPVINKLDLQSTHHSEDNEFVLNRLQKEETRESSAESESVVLDCVYETNGNDIVRTLYKSVTIDDTVKYIDPVENDTTNNSSFYLDEDTSETIRRKILAYSVSEGDSDDYGRSVDILGVSMDNIQNNQKNDFNISTALNDTTETSTETESTIVSAATKIQAGARGFLTRKRLRRASAGTKSSIQAHNKASFGNDAINESLEKLIAEEAAKKIQCAYRKHSHRRRNCPTSYRSTSSLEKSLAARRSTLQRGDALRNYSTPDEDNNGNVNDKRLQAETLISSSMLPSTVQCTTSSNSSNVYHKEKTTATDCAKNIIDNKLKWLVMRQNSMPVQIDSDLFRVIPKHIRKRIKSADGVNKRRQRILKD